MHRFSRAFFVALACSSAALSCAPIEPATAPPRPVPVPVAAPATPTAPPPAHIETEAPPPPPPRVETPATPPVAVQAPAPVPPPLAVAPPVAPTPPAKPAAGPAVTLLLPLAAPDFQRAAEALRQGFFAAMATASAQFDIVVRPTDASDERVLAEYDAAVQAGTRVIVGPMTRSSVGALAQSNRVAVPTIALNQPTRGVVPPRSLLIFGLSVDAEARQIARQAWNDTMRTAAVVSTATPLERRSYEAFVDEWLLLGGRITDVLELGAGVDTTQIRDALERNPPQFVFLSASGERARLLRPFLGSQTPVYATSQVNSTDDQVANLDLNGVHLVDMPWLVRPEDPAVALYPRPPTLERDVARFYALGIDTYRIAAALLEGRRAFEFDGVTGHISVTDTGAVERRPIAATFQDGKCVALR